MRDTDKERMRRYVAVVLFLSALAFCLASTDDYHVAVAMDRASEAEKAELLRHARAGLYAAYSTSGMPQHIRVAEVWR